MSGDSSISSCYACDEQAVSRDHVPPRVFYPEMKDVGISFRSNLITVPSCKRHNQDASVSDELAAYTVVVSISNNHLAMNQFSTKVLRAFNRNEYVQSLYLNTMKLQTIRGRVAPSFSINRADESCPVYEFSCHFDRTMEKIARGLYFHVLNRKLDHDAPLSVHSPQLTLPLHHSFVMENNARLLKNLQRYTWTELPTPHIQVFKCAYWFHPEFENQFVFWFCFYEGFHTLVFSRNILSLCE